MPPRFTRWLRGARGPVLYYDQLNKTFCTAANRTVVNGQTRCN